MDAARPTATGASSERRKHGVMTIAGAFDTMFGLSEFLEQKPATRCDIVALGSEPR